MNVACQQCTSVFRVDPAKVPAGGVRARCSVCSGVINVPEPSFEEPVASGGAGAWSGAEAPSWGRAQTPVGGWTPPPPAPYERPTPPPPTSYERVTPPSPARQETPPRPAPPPLVSQPPAYSADWGDWPSPLPGPFAGPGEQGAASSSPSPSADPWASHGANPLAPEMPSEASAPTPALPDYGVTQPEEPADEAEAAAGQWAPDAEVASDESTPDEEEGASDQAEEPAYEATNAPPGEAVSTGQAGEHVNPFLRRDPHERARRLARALASDIVTYYPDKHAEGVRDGNLRELFREEIKKSYDDYVAHVGAEMAQSTTYFQDALNEVVAGGKRLF